jgi:hypothetical protein
MLHYKEEE